MASKKRRLFIVEDLDEIKMPHGYSMFWVVVLRGLRFAKSELKLKDRGGFAKQKIYEIVEVKDV